MNFKANKKLFFVLLASVLLLGFVLRMLPTKNNNFYFTMDQGEEALLARDIWFLHKLPLLGQSASLPEVRDGPFWVWYLSIGYFIFGGHPFGALFMLILLKLTTIGLLIWRLAKRISPFAALLIGLSIELFWPFYDASRYAFSPFPLVSIGLATLVFLAGSYEKKWKFVLAAIPVGMTAHTEIASFAPFFFLCILVGIFGVIKKKIDFKIIFYFLAVLSIFFIPHIISDLSSNFTQLSTVIKHITTTSQFNIKKTNMFPIFIDLFEETVIPIKPLLALGAIFVAFLFFAVKLRQLILHQKKIKSINNPFVNRYCIFAVLLYLLSFIWFQSVKGWNPWHTLYIPPILFSALLLFIFNDLPKKLSLALFIFIISAQIIVFIQKYNIFFEPSSDPSILKNELSAIDWIYKQSRNQGFYVYIYVPSVYDYHYSYLIWWYGRKQYHYLPCEYSTYPNSPDFFVPNFDSYLTPTKPCDTNQRYLIIEPNDNGYIQKDWIDGVTKGTKLTASSKVGRIILQKRIVEEIK